MKFATKSNLLTLWYKCAANITVFYHTGRILYKLNTSLANNERLNSDKTHGAVC